MAATPSDLDSSHDGFDIEGLEGDGVLTEDASVAVTRRRPSVRREHAPAALRVLTCADGDGGPELRMLGELARGGMGRIDVAQQVPLGRQVAVKRSVMEHGSGEAREALLHEARLTGALEHPNIVPIHALGQSESGDVLLVMKHIEGTVWRKLLAGRSSHDDDLERHLEILMDVCRAVHFAHSRGVVHLDLKPDNVMVGAFGEVYVLDWGLAVSFGDGALPGVAHVRDLKGIGGTPAYMAPEMVIGFQQMDARTDVYLLGAILHEIVTGRPPHSGASTAELLEAVLQSELPPYSPSVPSELAAICRRALAAVQQERFASAEALRQAIAGFLRHAGVRALCRKADARLAQLGELVKTEGDDVPVHRAFSECRFGFQQALEEWPESPEARAGLTETVTTMARFELSRGRADGARRLLSELHEPPKDLLAQLAALDEEHAHAKRAKEELQAVRRELDARPAQTLRALLLLSAIVGWGCITMLHGFDVVALSHGHIFGVLAALCVVVAGGWLAHPALRQNEANRRMGAIVGIAVAGLTLVWVLAWRAELPLWVGFALNQLFIGTALAAGGLTVDRRLLPSAAMITLGHPIIVAWPQLAIEINALVGVLGFSHIAWVWRRAKPGRP